MSGGQEKIFSILGPKLSDSKAQQYYRDKILQIRVEQIDYICKTFSCSAFYYLSHPVQGSSKPKAVCSLLFLAITHPKDKVGKLLAFKQSHYKSQKYGLNACLLF